MATPLPEPLKCKSNSQLMLWTSKRSSKTRSVLSLIIFLRANQRETSYQLYDDSALSKYAWLKLNECSVESANMRSYQVWLTSGRTFYHYINVIQSNSSFCGSWALTSSAVDSKDSSLRSGLWALLSPLVFNIHLVEIESISKEQTSERIWYPAYVSMEQRGRSQVQIFLWYSLCEWGCNAWP